MTNFRCLDSVEVAPGAELNVIIGANGAGKTSLLEAMFVLGRGRSFRAGKPGSLIRSGTDEYTLFAEIRDGQSNRRVGVRGGRRGVDIRLDGEANGTAAELAQAFPVQVIDSQVHELVQGGPEERRRFLDWGVFHVKHRFLPQWRRYQRALRQRNHALRRGQNRAVVDSWNPELIAAADEIDAFRRDYVASLGTELGRIGETLIEETANCLYRSGWPSDQTFAAALAASWDTDSGQGFTHVGPHRAELVLEVGGEAARHRLSRGQQKLLGIALLLAQTRHVSGTTGRDVTLLVDEPAAELDAAHRARLISELSSLRAQLFVTALDREALPMDRPARMFHVEHGGVRTLV